MFVQVTLLKCELSVYLVLFIRRFMAALGGLLSLSRYLISLNPQR